MSAGGREGVAEHGLVPDEGSGAQQAAVIEEGNGSGGGEGTRHHRVDRGGQGNVVGDVRGVGVGTQRRRGGPDDLSDRSRHAGAEPHVAAVGGGQRVGSRRQGRDDQGRLVTADGGGPQRGAAVEELDHAGGRSGAGKGDRGREGDRVADVRLRGRV